MNRTSGKLTKRQKKADKSIERFHSLQLWWTVVVAAGLGISYAVDANRTPLFLNQPLNKPLNRPLTQSLGNSLSNPLNKSLNIFPQAAEGSGSLIERGIASEGELKVP